MTRRGAVRRGKSERCQYCNNREEFHIGRFYSVPPSGGFIKSPYLTSVVSKKRNPHNPLSRGVSAGRCQSLVFDPATRTFQPDEHSPEHYRRQRVKLCLLNDTTRGLSFASRAPAYQCRYELRCLDLMPFVLKVSACIALRWNLVSRRFSFVLRIASDLIAMMYLCVIDIYWHMPGKTTHSTCGFRSRSSANRSQKCVSKGAPLLLYILRIARPSRRPPIVSPTRPPAHPNRQTNKQKRTRALSRYCALN